MALKKLQVNLADLETLPIGAGTKITGEVWARYSHEVRLTDGKVIPVAQKREILDGTGLVEFDVMANDDPLVRAEDRGFAVVVGWDLSLKGELGRTNKVREYGRAVEVVVADPATVQFSAKTPVQPVPPQFVTVDQLVTSVDNAEASAAASATSAQDAAAAAATSASLVGAPADTAVKALVDNAASQTRASLNSTYAPKKDAEYLVAKYGQVDTTGVQDSSAAINAAINACFNEGGGTVVFPRGTIRWDSSPTLPRSGTDPQGAGVKYQPNMHLRGAGSIRGSLWGSGLQSRVGDSATVLKMGQTTGVAQIDTRGTGVLRISDLCFYDPSPTPVPFIQSTNTLLFIENVSFFGDPAVKEQACVKDAIVLGGSGTGSQNDTATSFFQGYGTHIRDVYFSSIRRGVYGKNAVNGVLLTNPVFSLSCGGSAGYAAIEFDGSGLDTLGNCVVNPILEMRGYVHTVRLGPHGRNTFINPGFYDPVAGSLACFYLFGGSSGNSVFGGNFQVANPSSFYADDGNAANGLGIHMGGIARQYPATRSAGFASAYTVIQPDAAQSNSAVLFRIKRSLAEATNPDQSLLYVQNDGTVQAGGSAASFNAGGTAVGASGIVRSSGDLPLYAGAAGSFITAARGHFQHTSGTTAQRPTVTGRTSVCYFDTTLGKPIWSNGSGGWVDAAGTVV